MYHKWVGCALFLAMVLVLSHTAVAAPYFRRTGLINIPTSDSVKRVIFDAGLHVAIHDQKRDELAMRIDFGVLSFVELGLMVLKKEGKDYVMGSAKVIISREFGSIPSLSIGVDDFGEKVRDASGSHERSIYGVLSKRFNLPVVHLIRGHLGFGGHRYVSDTSIGKYVHGVFMGLSKEMAFMNRRLFLMCELDGIGINAGLRYVMDSGLSASVGVGPLGSGEIKCYLGIGFTNEPIMEKIIDNSELAKRAVKIANETRSNTENIEIAK